MSEQNVPIEHLLFCVSGSVAATQTPSIIRVIVERQIVKHIHVALSRTARYFVSEHSIALLTNQPCITDLYESARKGDPAHVRIARICSVAIIAPATANTIGKLAHGIFDDTVSIMLSVFEGPILLVPAFHPLMFQKPSVRRNLERLKEDGFHICEPVAGFSISEQRRSEEFGAMPDADVVVANLECLIRFGKLPTA